MAIDDKDVIDLISDDEEGVHTFLTLLDPYDWNDQDDLLKHLTLIQDKLNNYLSFVESKELYRKRPSSIGKTIVISVMCQYQPSSVAREFYEAARSIVVSAGLKFELVVVEE